MKIRYLHEYDLNKKNEKKLTHQWSLMPSSFRLFSPFCCLSNTNNASVASTPCDFKLWITNHYISFRALPKCTKLPSAKTRCRMRHFTVEVLHHTILLPVCDFISKFIAVIHEQTKYCRHTAAIFCRSKQASTPHTLLPQLDTSRLQWWGGKRRYLVQMIKMILWASQEAVTGLCSAVYYYIYVELGNLYTKY